MRPFGHRMPFLVLLAALAPAIVAAGVAWACTPEANISLGSGSGVAGTSVDVTGSAFAANGRVELRWGSTTGQLLATATGPSFRSTVVIPDAQPGVYAFVAIGFNTDGTIAGRAPQTFEITAPNPAPATAPNPPAASDAVTPAVPAQPSPTASPTATPPAKAVSVAVSSKPRHATPIRTAPPNGHPRGQRASRPASANPAVVHTQGGREVFGGSLASLPAPKVHPARGRDNRSSQSRSDANTKLPRVQAPEDTSLLPSVTDEDVPEATSTSMLAIGVGLLSLGLVAIFAAFLIVGIRGRRAARGHRDVTRGRDDVGPRT